MATEHNKTMTNGVHLQQSDYEKIFDHKPTFQEKRAFVGLLRHKWKQAMKLTSMFDRRS